MKRNEGRLPSDKCRPWLEPSIW